jgi:hypothetical protein
MMPVSKLHLPYRSTVRWFRRSGEWRRKGVLPASRRDHDAGLSRVLHRKSLVLSATADRMVELSCCNNDVCSRLATD